MFGESLSIIIHTLLQNDAFLVHCRLGSLFEVYKILFQRRVEYLYCKFGTTTRVWEKTKFVFFLYTDWSPRSVSSRTMRGTRAKLRYDDVPYIPRVRMCIYHRPSTTIFVHYNIILYINVHYHRIMIDRVEYNSVTMTRLHIFLEYCYIYKGRH